MHFQFIPLVVVFLALELHASNCKDKFASQTTRERLIEVLRDEPNIGTMIRQVLEILSQHQPPSHFRATYDIYVTEIEINLRLLKPLNQEREKVIGNVISMVNTYFSSEAKLR